LLAHKHDGASTLFVSQTKQFDEEDSQVSHLSEQVITLADPTGESLIERDSASAGASGHDGGVVYPSAHVIQSVADPEQVSHWISQIPQAVTPSIS